MSTDNSNERYQRQIILSGFGKPAQDKLAAAKILIAGAGGLGCPALQYLVAAGVGTIGVIDDDIVALSNLHRQILYSPEDIGKNKAAVASARLGLLNPGVKINACEYRLNQHTALSLFPQYDIVLDGTDNFATRYMINDACALLKKPLIYGAVAKYEGQVASFNVADESGCTTNYRDLFPISPAHNEVLNCAEAGVLGVLTGIIGTMQAAEAIKLITGIGKPLINKLLTYDLLTNSLFQIELESTEKSKLLLPQTTEGFLQMNYHDLCNEKEIIEIDSDLFEKLRNSPSAIVIDVRETTELPRIENFKHAVMPMSVFADRLDQIKEQTVILLCSQGIRSLRAAKMLKEKCGLSKDVYSLKGGLVKWVDTLGFKES